jgi:hypothetical protein
MLVRILMSSGILFLSLILGAILLALVGYNSPETLSEMLGWARSLKQFIITRGLAPQYNIWVELLLEERQLLFMLFTIAARIILGALMALILLPFR